MSNSTIKFTDMEKAAKFTANLIQESILFKATESEGTLTIEILGY